MMGIEIPEEENVHQAGFKLKKKKMVRVPDIRLKMSNNSFNQGDTLINAG